jgi:hypothetical protein
MSDPNRIALAIGIDTYMNQNLEQLDSCKKDARDLALLLSQKEYTLYYEGSVIGSNLVKKY